MSFLSKLPVLGKVAEQVVDKLLPERGKVLEAQSSVNQAEATGAPVSRLRLWRSFLGWALTLAFVWEVVGRPLLCTYMPDVPMPPSMLDEVSALLMGMLGLGI